MKTLISAIVDIAKHKWGDIAIDLGWEFHDLTTLTEDYPTWSSSMKLRKILADFEAREGDSEKSRQHLIDACYNVKVGGALQTKLAREGDL